MNIAKYLSHAFLASNRFYLHLYLKKNSKRPLNASHSVSVAIVWYTCQSDLLTEMKTIKVSFTVMSNRYASNWLRHFLITPVRMNSCTRSLICRRVREATVSHKK